MGISSFERTVTEMLVKDFEKWYGAFKNVCVEYRQQVGCRYKNGGHGIVDLVVHIFMPRKPESGSWYNFEIKSNISDLNTGRGMNLYAMYNYVVYPRSMIKSLPGVLTYETVEAKLQEIGCDHAGIIAIISDDDFVVERKARRYYGDGMPDAIKAHEHKSCRFRPTQ